MHEKNNQILYTMGIQIYQKINPKILVITDIEPQDPLAYNLLIRMIKVLDVNLNNFKILYTAKNLNLDNIKNYQIILCLGQYNIDNLNNLKNIYFSYSVYELLKNPDLKRAAYKVLLEVKTIYAGK